MMSRTGNRDKAFIQPLRARAGFTLIEIMITTVIFSLAAVLIYETFFRSLELVNYCDDYFKAVSWVDDKMWQAQNELTRFNGLRDTPRSDTFAMGNKNFSWNISYEPASPAPNIYRIDSTLSWREGSKSVAISRSAYANYEEPEQ